MEGWTRVGVTHEIEHQPDKGFGSVGYVIFRLINVNRNDETGETRLHHNGARVIVEADGIINTTGGSFDLDEAVAMGNALANAIAFVRAKGLTEVA